MQTRNKISSLDALDRKGGASVENIYLALDLYKSYLKMMPGTSNSFAIAAVYECGKIDGIREERARRKKNK